MLLDVPRSGDGNAIALGAAMVAWIGLIAVSAFSGQGKGGDGGKRDSRSLAGILIQGFGVGAAWFGRFDIVVGSTPALLLAALIPSAIALGSLALFAWSVQTMGKNWAVVAQTRGDHQLVQTGPFALVRNPIYVAIFGMMVATALAIGHAYNLIVAVPLYVFGTLMRVGLEEQLLGATFGDAYVAYRQRVKRFIPGIW